MLRYESAKNKRVNVLDLTSNTSFTRLNKPLYKLGLLVMVKLELTLAELAIEWIGSKI